jgi:hypothetical protein
LTIRNSKLTLTHRLHADESCDSSMQHCLSTRAASAATVDQMLWSEKTTVCRIFSCQRSSWMGATPPCPRARSLAGPLCPAPFARHGCFSRDLSVAKESVNVGCGSEPKDSTISADVGVRWRTCLRRSCRVSCVATPTQRQQRPASFARRIFQRSEQIQ